MKTLRDALLKAGAVTKETRLEIEKQKVHARHRETGKQVKKDQIQIVCEVCDKSAPDVERYEHNNRRIYGKKWLCIQCADEYEISDDCRQTNQSTQAKGNLFIRRYGRTKRFPKT